MQSVSITTTLWVRITLRGGVLDTTLCDKVCQWLSTGLWFSSVSSSNKTDLCTKTDILLKVALNTITLTLIFLKWLIWCLFMFWMYFLSKYLVRKKKIQIIDTLCIWNINRWSCRDFHEFKIMYSSTFYTHVFLLSNLFYVHWDITLKQALHGGSYVSSYL
jgi:hypothetical protein